MVSPLPKPRERFGRSILHEATHQVRWHDNARSDPLCMQELHHDVPSSVAFWDGCPRETPPLARHRATAQTAEVPCRRLCGRVRIKYPTQQPLAVRYCLKSLSLAGTTSPISNLR